MNILRRFILGCAVTAFIVVGMAFLLSPWFWFAALFTHFVPVYAVGAWVCVLLAFKQQRLYWAIFAALLTTWCLYSPLQIKAIDYHYDLLFYNAHIDNPAPEQDVQAILERNTALVALVEQSSDAPRWQALVSAYPYRCTRDDLGVFSLWLGSKQPLVSCQTGAVEGVGWLRAEVDDSVIYVLHPPPPIAELAALQQDYLALMAKKIAAETQPVLVVGDLNQTPFSLAFWQFIYHAGLSTQMMNTAPTWQPGMLHIDHVLTRDISAEVNLLPWWHSDHRALWVLWRNLD